MNYLAMKGFYKKYERHLTSLAFLVGFAIDNLTIQRVDRWFEHVILLLHILFSALLIVVYNTVTIRQPSNWYLSRGFAKLVTWFPIFIQFSFGALLSGSLIFYSRSASLSVSWPFLILLVIFVIGNELVHGRYGRLTFQLSGFFVAVFLYLSFALPVFVHSMSTSLFVIGELLSLGLTLSVIRLLKWLSRGKFVQKCTLLYVSIISLFGLFNILYFGNFIPPLPLSIKEIGVYHSVLRDTSGNYVLEYEPASWYHFRLINPIFHVENTGIAYIFSAVFAPTKLTTEIVHEWFFKNKETGEWESKGIISFPIIGGRDNGYRGYSSKKVYPGSWRVDVKTSRGSLIGRTVFKVEISENPITIETSRR